MFKNISFVASTVLFVLFAVSYPLNVRAQEVDHSNVKVSVAKSGTFTGLSQHVTKGGVSVINTGNGYLLLLENNFSLDGAPGPTIGFGNDGKFDGATEFTKLTKENGVQVYSVPANIDVGSFSEVYIWCADFSVPLGVAKLK